MAPRLPTVCDPRTSLALEPHLQNALAVACDGEPGDTHKKWASQAGTGSVLNRGTDQDGTAPTAPRASACAFQDQGIAALLSLFGRRWIAAGGTP